MDFASIPVLATAISIIICWSLFAMFCSFLHEAIAQIKAERGRFMRKYLFKQLYDQPNGVNWASMLYMHGTVDLLTRATNMPTNHIAPKLFAETLIEVVGKAQVTQMKMAQVETSLTYRNYLLRDFQAATLVLEPSDVVSFFRQSLSSADVLAGQAGTRDEAIVYANLVVHIESWYQEMTGRLSLWYKKRTRLRLFILGALLGLIINMDSAQLFGHFNRSEASRNVVMNYYEVNSERLEAAARAASGSQAFDSVQRELRLFRQEMDSVIKEAALPVGWKYSILNPSGERSGGYLTKLLGVLISGFAASFGAPFWFDLLKKIYSRKPKND
jgi:hypothetical protein